MSERILYPRQHDTMLDLERVSPRQADLAGEKPKPLNLRVPKDLYDKLVLEAQKKGCSLNLLCIEKLRKKK